jgi:hypothetical protein
MKRRKNSRTTEKDRFQVGRERAIEDFNIKFEDWKQDYRVSVYRVLDKKKMVFLGSFSQEQVDESIVRDLYGAGKYVLKLIDGGGRWLSQVTICIG